MSLSDYEKVCVRTWALQHARANAGKKQPVDALLADAAKISGFLMGSPSCEIVPINNNSHKAEEVWWDIKGIMRETGRNASLYWGDFAASIRNYIEICGGGRREVKIALSVRLRQRLNIYVFTGSQRTVIVGEGIKIERDYWVGKSIIKLQEL